jgi:hypothetical protein
VGVVERGGVLGPGKSQATLPDGTNVHYLSIGDGSLKVLCKLLSQTLRSGVGVGGDKKER